jgi:BirA family biotin operon repressor/biotin-[acetyl-CoA-carboxylase] ligase
MSGLDIERVGSLLQSGEIRWSLHYEAACESTQDLARVAVGDGVEEGWVVVTDLQRQGRGRQGRTWIAPSGKALLFSVVLRPPIDVIPLMPLVVGLSVAGGIELSTGAAPDLKWPNDVLLNRKKLAGILLERPPGSAVIAGVGINVNQQPSELPEGGTSLATALGSAVEREPLLAAILNDLGNAYERADRESVTWIVPAWRSRSSMLGNPITFQQNSALVEAVAEDISDDGALLVRLADGSRLALLAGEVASVRLV